MAFCLFSKKVTLTASTFSVLNRTCRIKLGLGRVIVMVGLTPLSTGNTNVVFEVSRFSGTVEMERFGSDVTSVIAH